MRDAVNKAARLVINHCLQNGIGTLVFGWNVGQKDGLFKNLSVFRPESVKVYRNISSKYASSLDKDSTTIIQDYFNMYNSNRLGQELSSKETELV